MAEPLPQVSEREATTVVRATEDATLVIELATGAVIKNYHPRLTSMAVAFHEGIEYARAALSGEARPAQDAAPAKESQAPWRNEEVFSALGLDPDRYITEGGAINRSKLRAAILHPYEYLPPDHWLRAQSGVLPDALTVFPGSPLPPLYAAPAPVPEPELGASCTATALDASAGIRDAASASGRWCDHPLSAVHRSRQSLDGVEAEYAKNYYVEQIDAKYRRDKARGLTMDSISYYLGDLAYWLRHYVYSEPDSAAAEVPRDQQAPSESSGRGGA